VTARELPAKATPVTPADVFLALRLQLAAQLEAPAPRHAATILLGQMALETGRFRSVMNYNLGGIKCPRNWPGCWQHFTTTERLPAASAAKYLAEVPPDAAVELVTRDGDLWTLRFRGKHPVNRFVAFESLEAAVEHHVAFLLGRYRSAVTIAVETGDARAYVRECHRLKYFTGPPDTYADSVASLAREYDRTMPADPPEPVPAPQTPQNAPVSLAATVAAPEPETPRVETPSAPAEPAPRPVPAPAVVPAPLPRIGDRLEVQKPWWLRLLGVLVRLFVRKPLP
jgi:hypothetical protein